jgi:perosamine synthetase
MSDKEPYAKIVAFIRTMYGSGVIPLHAPVFIGNEKEYLNECIDSTFVSSVGKFVDRFEAEMAAFTRAKKAVAAVNGTNALQAALRLVGVEPSTEVITQPLTFVATCNAIKYLYADPVFIDVDRDTLGMSPDSLKSFLEEYGEKRNGETWNKITGKKIGAILPMHTFGHPVRMEDIMATAQEWNIPVVEDAAESIGSYIGNKHTGLFGKLGVLSFNGNKAITTGGGGMIITNDEELGQKAKHLTTTAKIPHKWEFFHDELGYNFRMPNINAALGCAQLEKLPFILKNKRETAEKYKTFFESVTDVDFVSERSDTISNYWLNAVICKNRQARDEFLRITNNESIMTRPVWTLMTKLPMYKDCLSVPLPNAGWLEDRVVNVPSGVC